MPGKFIQHHSLLILFSGEEAVKVNKDLNQTMRTQDSSDTASLGLITTAQEGKPDRQQPQP